MNTQRRLSFHGVLGWIFLTLLVLLPVAGHSATVTVNTMDELRAAIIAANAPSEADTILVSSGTYTLTGVAGEDAAATGDLDIIAAGGPLTITGAGAATTIIDGGGIDRVFETIGAATVTISGVTIRNGNPGLNANGGAINTSGGTDLTLNNVVMTDSTATGEGGAIAIGAGATVRMNTVAVSNNSSPGGAINNGAGSTLTITNGTINGNDDRGINNSGTLSLTNVTISGNTTAGDGAGIDNDGTVELLNVTITGNTAPVNVPPTNVGGIQNVVPGTVTVRNTIISDNTPLNCGGGAALTSLGNNIESTNTCGLNVAAGDRIDTDPLLGLLADNGSIVQPILQTHALLTDRPAPATPPDSPAIDAGATGPGVCPDTDARGILRPVDGNILVPDAVPLAPGEILLSPVLDDTPTCDIGAFEFRPQTVAVTPPTIDFGVVTIGTVTTQTATVTNTGDGALRVIIDSHLSPPISVAADASTCPVVPPGLALALGQSCTVTVRFAPTSVSVPAGTFHIVSNDPTKPLHDSLEFPVSGSGAASDIVVTDSIAPDRDLQVPFGSVAVGSTADATVTVTNTGTIGLVIGTVAGANPLAAPFSITGNACSSQTIAPNANCTITVRFAPTDNSSAVDSFDIPSNDPGTPVITIVVSGAGISTTGNNPPSVPVLVSPANLAIVSAASVTFTWQRSTDPDGDAVTHRFFICLNDPGFTGPGCGPVDVASASSSGLAYAGLGSLGAGIILVGFVAGTGFRRSRKAMLMIVALLLLGVLFVACNGGGGGGPVTPPIQEMSHTVTGLNPSALYYWKVVADDGRGGTSTSEVRSFTTQ
jgi:hypothetical protein